MDLQALADQPGYGKARLALIKNGKWDEWVGMEYREYSVELSAIVPYEESYTIKARHKDEAERLAAHKFITDYDGASNDDITEIEVEEME